MRYYLLNRKNLWSCAKQVVRDRHKYDEALEINDRRLMAAEPDTPQYALVTYHRSLIYKYLGDKIREKQNLCLSAISDIRSAIKDHASLWMLAQLLYENGDMERAYQYMRFSWNATKFYNVVFEVGRVPMCFL